MVLIITFDQLAIIMSHIFTAEGLGRDFLSKSLGGLASRVAPSLLHNGPGSHSNISSQVGFNFLFTYLLILYYILLIIYSYSFCIINNQRQKIVHKFFMSKFADQFFSSFQNLNTASNIKIPRESFFLFKLYVSNKKKKEREKRIVHLCVLCFVFIFWRIQFHVYLKKNHFFVSFYVLSIIK